MPDTSVYRIIFFLRLVTIPVIGWLLYRFFFTGGFSPGDYLLMGLFFVLTFIIDRLNRKHRSVE